MADLSDDQKKRLQEISERAGQISKSAQIGLVAKLAQTALGVFVGPVTGGAAGGIQVPGAFSEVGGAMKELTELEKEKEGILQAAEQNAATITVPKVEITFDDGKGGDVFTVGPVVITTDGPDVVKIPPVVFTRTGGEESSVFTLPEQVIVGKVPPTDVNPRGDGSEGVGDAGGQTGEGGVDRSTDAGAQPPGGERDGGESHGDDEGGCFVGSTPVLMADGARKPIEAISIGDLVMARDERTGAGAPCVVSARYRHLVTKTLRLGVQGGEVVETTAVHRFALDDGKFKSADDLNLGDRLGTFGAEGIAITEVTPCKAETVVFNLTVDQLHTFFVGGAELWVHNLKKDDPEE